MELSLRCNAQCCVKCGDSKCANGCVNGCGDRCGQICGRVAAYGWGLPIRCNHHRMLPMNVCCNVRCSASACHEFPIYGVPERQPKRCKLHILPQDVLSKGDICNYPGCCVERFPNIEYCILHTKRDQTIPGYAVINGKLQCCSVNSCTLNAIYGFYNTGKLFCIFHSALDVNIHAVEHNLVECSRCYRSATQYLDISVLKANPYAAPNICISCALDSGVKIHEYRNCAKCGCYTIMFVGDACASCYVAGFNNQLIIDNWDTLTRPINKRFIVKRTTTGEFICTIRSRICKNGNRNVFTLPMRSGALAPNRYTKFILNADARTPVRNRYIRSKLLSDSVETLVVMNENSPSDNYVVAEETFLREFTTNVLNTFKYYTLDGVVAQKDKPQSLTIEEFAELSARSLRCK